jgi:hypothetical protein
VPAEWRSRPNTADRTVDPASLTLGFVEVIETAPQAGKGVKPVVWRIVTTLPVTKPHEVDRVVRIYRLRWRIEQLFRIMKSDGLKLEDSQLEAAHRLFKVSALALVAAARIIMLVDARDGGPRPASNLIAPELIEPVAAIARSLQGKTTKQQNRHPWRWRCGAGSAWRTCARSCCRRARSASPGRRSPPCW